MNKKDIQNHQPPARSSAKRMMAKDRRPNREIQKIAFHGELFAGPIPPPKMLAEYNKAQPDAADRILQMAERQQVHKHRIEGETIEGRIRHADRGQYFSAIISFASIIAGVLSMWFGFPGYAIILWSPSGVLIAVSVIIRITNQIVDAKAHIKVQNEAQPTQKKRGNPRVAK